MKKRSASLTPLRAFFASTASTFFALVIGYEAFWLR